MLLQTVLGALLVAVSPGGSLRPPLQAPASPASLQVCNAKQPMQKWSLFPSTKKIKVVGLDSDGASVDSCFSVDATSASAAPSAVLPPPPEMLATTPKTPQVLCRPCANSSEWALVRSANGVVQYKYIMASADATTPANDQCLAVYSNHGFAVGRQLSIAPCSDTEATAFRPSAPSMLVHNASGKC